MAITSLIVANLSSTSTYVASFVVEVYTDSGLTNLYGSGSCGSIGNGSGGSIQASSIVIGGLTFGQTYYTRAGVVAPVTSITTWSATSSIIAGSSTAPSGVTYTGTLTATTSGVTCSVTPASAPSDILKYEAIWNTDGSTPASTASPMWSGPTDGTGVLHFFAGSTPGNTIHVFVRAVNTAGLRQSWVSLGAGALVITPVSASDIQQEKYTYAADTGSANAYAVTLSPAPTIVAGSEVNFKAAHANTGASTLAINGGTATAITKNGTTALSAGDIATGQIITARYDGTEWQILTGGGGITQLTGDVTAGPGTGSQVATLANTGVVAGTYSNPTVTFDSKGRATSAVNGGTPLASNFVQVNKASGLSVLSSGAYTPIAGRPLIVGVFLSSGDFPNVTGISDTAGNTWVSAGSYTNFSGIRLWVCYSPSGTSTTINVALSTTSGSAAIVSLIQYSSIYAQDGGIAGGSHNIAATQVITGSITTSNANDLLVAFGGTLSSNAACTTPSPFTTDGTGYNSAPGSPASCFGSQLVSATGSYTATVNLNTTVNGPSAVIVAFKVAGGGSGVTSFNSRTGVVVPTTGDYSFSQISGSAAVSQLPVLVGDSGSGGTAGIVPAPAAGTASAGKFLKADGTWAVPAAASGSNATQIQGVAVSTAAPTTGQVLAYNGSLWLPSTTSGSGGSSISIGTRASLPASPGLAGTTYNCTDSPYRYVSDGTSWKASVYGVPVTEPSTSVLSQIYGTTNTPDTSRGGLNIPMPTANDAMYGVAKPSASSWSAVAGFIPRMAQAQFSQCSLILYDSGSTKATMVSWLNPWNAGKSYEVTKWSNAVTGTFNSAYTIPNTGGSSTVQGYGDNYRGMAGLLWFRVNITSSNISYYLCHDPWTTDATELILTTTLTDWLPAITHVGVRSAVNVGTMWLQHFSAA